MFHLCYHHQYKMKNLQILFNVKPSASSFEMLFISKTLLWWIVTIKVAFFLYFWREYTWCSEWHFEIALPVTFQLRIHISFLVSNKGTNFVNSPHCLQLEWNVWLISIMLHAHPMLLDRLLLFNIKPPCPPLFLFYILNGRINSFLYKSFDAWLKMPFQSPN